MTMLLWDMVAPLANASVVELAFLVVVPDAGTDRPLRQPRALDRATAALRGRERRACRALHWRGDVALRPDWLRGL